MRRQSLRLLLVIAVLAVSLNFVEVRTAQAARTVPLEIIVLIEDASYASLEPDGLENDIVYVMSIDLLAFRWYHYQYGFIFTVYVGLETPSGNQVWYRVDCISYRPCCFMGFEFHNYANELGIYTAHAIGVTANSRYVVWCQMEFDPPGGKPGGDPFAVAYLY